MTEQVFPEEYECTHLTIRVKDDMQSYATYRISGFNCVSLLIVNCEKY